MEKCEQKTSWKQRILKFKSLILTVMLLIQLFGLVSFIGIRAVNAQTEYYSMSNVVYGNYTGLGALDENGTQTFFIERIEIDKNGIITDTHGGKMKSQADFQARGSVRTVEFQSFTEFYDQANNPVAVIADEQISLVGTQFGYFEHYANGSYIGVNSSDFFSNFDYSKTSAPVEKEIIYFDSPYNYAYEYGQQNGYTLINVVNSTYDENWSPQNLAFLQSQLVQTDYLLCNPIANISGLGGSGEIHQQITGLEIALIVAIIVSAVMFFLTFEDIGRMALIGHQATLDQQVTLTAINAERDVQLAQTQSVSEKQATILEMVNNGTITIEEAQALLSAIGSSYEFINNRSTNFDDLVDQYYDHVDDQWSNHYSPLLSQTSWVNYIWLIITLIIIGLVLYAIYRVFGSKSKETKMVVMPMGYAS